jgi:hypothetical protein
MRKTLVLVLVTLVIIGGQPVLAQEKTPLTGEQHALLEIINSAVDQMAQLTSYSFHQNWTGIDQVIFGDSGDTATIHATFFCGVLAQFDDEGNLDLCAG